MVKVSVVNMDIEFLITYINIAYVKNEIDLSKEYSESTGRNEFI